LRFGYAGGTRDAGNPAALIMHLSGATGHLRTGLSRMTGSSS
jgi:hypothetical protein